MQGKVEQTHLQVPLWQAQTLALRDNPVGNHQLSRVVPRHGTGKLPQLQILCLGEVGGLNS